MNLPVGIALQSVAFPLFFSVVGLALVRRRGLDAAVMIGAWWLAYFWMVGFPDWPPIKALDWAGLLAALSATISSRMSGHCLLWGQALLFAVAPFVLGWPLIAHQPTVGLLVELAGMAVIGVLTVVWIAKNPVRRHTSVLLINAAGLAIASSLTGSLLIGELAAALASCLGGWLLYDITWRRKSPRDDSSIEHTVPVALLLLALFLNARLYADLPLIVLGCLLIIPLIVLLPTWRDA